MVKAWTSNTLPKAPKRPPSMSAEKYADLYFARLQAHSDLLRAEQIEKEAASYRGIANQSVEHFRTLLEELTTQPLFEVE
ncbi:MAG: hypothetical protein HOV97_05770 [Nonomuraea sp.]|nr:hypothetical protein [Nonomuraea sp.]